MRYFLTILATFLSLPSLFAGETGSIVVEAESYWSDIEISGSAAQSIYQVLLDQEANSLTTVRETLEESGVYTSCTHTLPASYSCQRNGRRLAASGAHALFAALSSSSEADFAETNIVSGAQIFCRHTQIFRHLEKETDHLICKTSLNDRGTFRKRDPLMIGVLN